MIVIWWVWQLVETGCASSFGVHTRCNPPAQTVTFIPGPVLGALDAAAMLSANPRQCAIV